MSPDRYAPSRSLYYSARDGLRLHARCYDAPGSRRRPVLCLAGLTRNSRDFHDLAVALSIGPGGAHRLGARQPRARALRARSELAELLGAGRDAGRDRPCDDGRAAWRDDRRYLARRPHRHGAGGSAADDHRRGRSQRHRAGDRARRAGADRRLCRAHAAAGIVEGSAANSIADMSRRISPTCPPRSGRRSRAPGSTRKMAGPPPGYDPAIGRSRYRLPPRRFPQLWPQFLALQRVPVLAIRGANSDILVRGDADSDAASAIPIAPPSSSQARDTRRFSRIEPTIGAIAAFPDAVERRESVRPRIRPSMSSMTSRCRDAARPHSALSGRCCSTRRSPRRRSRARRPIRPCRRRRLPSSRTARAS